MSEFEDYSEVYCESVWDSEIHIPMIGGTYYQCGGGGPEYGYVVKDGRVWFVERSWFEPWNIISLKSFLIKFHIEDHGHTKIKYIEEKWRQNEARVRAGIQ
jgi:hypothetical protein